jgi:hypothetical protein
MSAHALAAFAGLAAVIAAGFLAYSLTHLAQLDISATHPRVLVEAAIAVGCAVLAVALISR